MVCWCERLVRYPGSHAEPCCWGAFAPGLLQAPQSAYRIGCLGAAPPTRIEGRLGREGLTRYEASSTQHVQSPQGKEAPNRVTSLSGACRAGARDQRERGTHAARSQPSGGRYQYVHFIVYLEL